MKQNSIANNTLALRTWSRLPLTDKGTVEDVKNKCLIKNLLILQYRYDGITQNMFNKLSNNEKKFLEKRRKKYYVKNKYRKMITVVMTGGVFDVLHYGHLTTLRKAKSYGDLLVVVIAKDENVEKIKGKTPVHNERYRMEIVGELKPVDIVLIGKKHRMETLKRIEPDIIVFGYDQEPFVSDEKYKIVKLRKKVGKFKSSKIRDLLS